MTDWAIFLCTISINDTAKFSHKIHLQKALVILGKNSVIIEYLHFLGPSRLLMHSGIIYTGLQVHHHCYTGN